MSALPKSGFCTWLRAGANAFRTDDSVMELSNKSRRILEGIAAGHSFEEILADHQELSHHDIIEAAAEALNCIDQGKTGKAYSLDAIRHKHARAYEPWSAREDAQLVDMFRCGLRTADIAEKLERQPSAIRSRLKKLNLPKAT